MRFDNRTTKEITKDIKHLKNEYRYGFLTTTEVIVRFNKLIEDIEVIKGKTHPVSKMLRETFKEMLKKFDYEMRLLNKLEEELNMSKKYRIEAGLS